MLPSPTGSSDTCVAPMTVALYSLLKLHNTFPYPYKRSATLIGHKARLQPLHHRNCLYFCPRPRPSGAFQTSHRGPFQCRSRKHCSRTCGPRPNMAHPARARGISISMTLHIRPWDGLRMNDVSTTSVRSIWPSPIARRNAPNILTSNSNIFNNKFRIKIKTGPDSIRGPKS
jgi:hypothetical protein